MSEHALLLTPVGLLLAGAMCLAWSAAATGVSRRRRQLAAEALWSAGGLLGLGVIGITVAHLCTQPVVKTTIGTAVIGIFIGGMVAFTAVALLGYVGVWARLRHRRHGAVGNPSAGRVDVAFSSPRVDPSAIVDHDSGDNEFR